PRTLGGLGASSGPLATQSRGAPRLCRGAPSVGGVGGQFGAPRDAIQRGATALPGRPERWGGWGPVRGPSRRNPEGRHGFAGGPRTLGGLGAISGPPCSYVVLVQVERALDRRVGALAAPGSAHHARAVGAGVAARSGARHRGRRAADGALRAAALGRDVLRRVLPQRPAAGVDVFLVLRRAAAAAARRAGLALQPRRRVLGRHARAR